MTSHTARTFLYCEGFLSEYLFSQLSNALNEHADNKWQTQGTISLRHARMSCRPRGLSVPEILCDALLSLVPLPCLMGEQPRFYFQYGFKV